MKLLHTSDLHIGKRLHELSLADWQETVLQDIKDIALREKVDAFIVAGDIFDRAQPSTEAVRIYDAFMRSLFSSFRGPVMITSGNHDSVDRLSMNSEIIKNDGVYISPSFTEHGIEKVELEDEYGRINFFLFPYLSPGMIRDRYSLSSTPSWDDAFTLLFEKMEEEGSLDWNERNVAVMHQYITGSERSDSEMDIGGIDAVSSSVLEKFDYVALGHLHRPQLAAGAKHINYSGTPLMYSFSEERDKKSVSIVTIGKKGEEPVIERLPLPTPYTLKRKEGSFEDLLKEGRERAKDNTFWSFTLTDDAAPSGALTDLRALWGEVLELRVKEKEWSLSEAESVMRSADGSERSPFEIVLDYFNEMNRDTPLSEKGEALLSELIEEAEGKIKEKEALS